MRILFDHQIFRSQRYGGISLYIGQLLQSINDQEDYSARITLPYFENENLPQLTTDQNPMRRKLWDLMPRKGRRVSNAFSLQAMLTNQYDLFHATYYDPYFLKGLRRDKPWTVTFHDMIHESMGRRFPGLPHGKSLIQAKQMLAQKALLLIAISEFTKQQMVYHYQIDPNRIHVVHHGNPYEYRQPMSQTESVYDFPYLLFVGHRWLYKNFDLFLRAATSVVKRYGVKIVCAGGNAFTASEMELIARCGLTGQVYHRPIQNDDLPILYQHALAFVFPSLQEGFGFPVLEAFACGCPCIVSSNSCFPEIAGPDAAVYFDPEQIESITKAIEHVVSYTPEERDRLIDYGRDRLTLFSWQKTARETLHVYRQVANHRTGPMIPSGPIMSTPSV